MAEARKRIEQARRDGSTELDLSGLRLTTLPEALGKLGKLERLILEGNALRELPESLRNLEGLKELTLHGNEALAKAGGSLSTIAANGAMPSTRSGTA